MINDEVRHIIEPELQPGEELLSTEVFARHETKMKLYAHILVTLLIVMLVSISCLFVLNANFDLRVFRYAYLFAFFMGAVLLVLKKTRWMKILEDLAKFQKYNAVGITSLRLFFADTDSKKLFTLNPGEIQAVFPDFAVGGVPVLSIKTSSFHKAYIVSRLEMSQASNLISQITGKVSS